MPENFIRDHAAGSALAAQFGSGAGTAEQLIEANQFRFSPELTAASSLGKDEKATEAIDKAEVGELVGVPPKQIIDVAVRGDYCVYVAEDERGRTFKGVLAHDDGALESIDPGDDPRRARLQAAAQAATEIETAQAKAEQIVADAQEKAAKIVADASQAGAEAQAKASEDAAKAQAKAAEDEKKAAAKSAEDARKAAAKK